MTYKHIFLFTLFATSALQAHDKNIQKRIDVLEEMLFKKLTELSDLGKVIAEKDEFLRSCKEKLRPIFAAAKEKKIAYLEKERGSLLSPEEINKIGQDLEASLDLFIDKFYYEEKITTKEMIIAELYDQEHLDSPTSFESMKFFLLRAIGERELLAIFANKYATCIEEAIKINTELKSLRE